MFDNLLGDIREKFRASQDRKRAEKEEIDKMQREADFRARQVFQEEFQKNANKIAIDRAKREAASKSGMQKLIAENRVRRMEEPGANDPSNFFNKFSSYTQKNLARREQNMKRTKEMQEVAKKMREEKGDNNPTTNPGIRKPFQVQPQRRKPFEPSGFGR